MIRVALLISATSLAGAIGAALPVEPITAILHAFRSHQLVAIGDAHGNEKGEAFQLALIQDPRFPSVVNDIVIEVGNARYQATVDDYVRGVNVPEAALQRVWNDTTQPQFATMETPEIVRTVRRVNASLPSDRRLRLLLGDPPIDWDRIRTAGDLRTWHEDPRSDRDRHAADLIRREVIAKRRRALALYGAGHFFRKNINHSIVSLLEDAGVTRAFTVWTNAVADLASLQDDVASWPVPSLALVTGTSLGTANFSSYFRPGTQLPDQWRVPMEDQFDAVLYLGPASAITFRRPSPLRCADPIFVEQLRRLALSPMTERLVERKKRECRA